MKVDLPDEKVPYYLMLGMALSYDFTRSERSPDGEPDLSQTPKEMTGE